MNQFGKKSWKMLVLINKLMFYEAKLNESKFSLAPSSIWLKAQIRMTAGPFLTDIMVTHHNFRPSGCITTFHSLRRLAILLILAWCYSTTYITQLWLAYSCSLSSDPSKAFQRDQWWKKYQQNLHNKSWRKQAWQKPVATANWVSQSQKCCSWYWCHFKEMRFSDVHLCVRYSHDPLINSTTTAQLFGVTLTADIRNIILW